MDIESTLSALRESGNLRRVPADSRASAAVDLSGNDYLGLAVRDDLRREFMAEACERGYAMSASASRLLASDERAANSTPWSAASRRPTAARPCSSTAATTPTRA